MIEVQSTFEKHFWGPLKSGLIGFVIFLALIVCIKLINKLLGQNYSFEINIEDMILSTVGFGLMFLIKYLENISAKKF